MLSTISSKVPAICGVILCLALAIAARAVDGVVLIDQQHALAGGVTPGDAPGFPVTISLPGIYKLSSNLTVPNADTSAIVITSDSVTIDLNGFSILGPVSCLSDGLHATPGCTVGGVACPGGFCGSGIGVDSGNAGKLNTRVVNGTVNGMGLVGIYLDKNSRVEGVNVTSNGQYGIYTSGGEIRDVLLRANGGNGITTSGSLIVNTRSLFNAAVGIYCGAGSYINGSIIQGNASYGIVVTANTRYTDNLFSDNNGGGVQISGGTSAGANTCGAAACP